MDKSITDFNVRLRTIRIMELIVGIILTAILTGVLAVVFPDVGESDELFFIVFLLIGALLFVWALRGTRGLDQNIENIFEEHTKKEILFVFATNLLFAFFVTFLISSVDLIIGMTDPTWISVWDVDTVDVDSSAVILDTIGAIIFAPIMEELVFRGVLFNRLKIRTGIFPAMIISSFIFAIGHDFGGITSAFIFGVCMCILYLKTDNILIPMSVHFINNVAATLLQISGVDAFLSEFPWFIPFVIITIIGSFYLIRYVIRECKELKKQYS